MTPMVEASLKQIDRVNPAKRFGKPHEVGAVVAFLLSGEASFVNATVIPIDGGQSYKY
jgi:NAD(P)-dependent dehydrogenase (short-subunit alcohol dehydrogenase family)